MRLLLCAIIGLLLTITLILFWPQSEEHIPQQNNLDQTIPSVTDNQVDSDSQEDTRIAGMRENYEILEQRRLQLSKRLGKLKHQLWGLEFTQKQATYIRDSMASAYKLVRKNRKLGSFSNVQSIQHELAKVNVALNQLSEISKLVDHERGMRESESATTVQ